MAKGSGTHGTDQAGEAGYRAVTRSILVTVQPIFLEDQSAPEDNHFVWAYMIRIENQGSDTVQLRNRYWHITDATAQQGTVADSRRALRCCERFAPRR